MNEISLETIYSIIDLCKYSEIDGEKAELVVSPSDNDSRNIRIGINGGFSREFFEYSYQDGAKFDKEILPLIVNHFLKGEKISSWVTNDPKIEDLPTKELIVSDKENEILIQTFDKGLHDLIKDNAEKIQLKDEEVVFTKEELACEKILKYLKEKNKRRPEIEKLDETIRAEVIAIIDQAYNLNKGRTLSDEQIYNFVNNINDGISKEAYNAIVTDIRNNNSLLIGEIKDYLRNEHKYENYLDEEPYMSLRDVGEKMIAKGYYELRYTFPQKAELMNFDAKELENVLTSRYKSKYKLLAEMKTAAETEKNQKESQILDTYMSYLVKTTRARLNKSNKKKEKAFKEVKQDYKLDDSKTMIDALKLYKGGKLDSEKLEVIVTESEDSYEVNIRLSNGTSRDNNLFKFTKNDTFAKDIVPKLINELENGDLITNEKEDGSKLLFTTNNGNELLIESKLLEFTKYKAELVEVLTKVVELKKEEPAPVVTEPVKEEPKTDAPKEEEKKEELTLKSDSKYLGSYFRKEILREKGLLSAAGLAEMKKLEAESEDVKAIEDAKKQLNAGTMSQEKFDEIYKGYKALAAKYASRGLRRPERKVVKKEEEEIKDDTEFGYLHQLLRRYKIQNISGELKAVNRETKQEIVFNNEDDLLAVEFANYWNSAAGVRSVNDKDILGETYAFSEDGRKLFEIVNNNFKDKELNLDNIFKEFISSGVPTSEEIFERLFRDNDHIEFVKSGLECFNKAYRIKNLDVTEENLDLKDIRDEFTRIDNESDLDNPANLIIEYRDTGYVEVRLQDEKNGDSEITLRKKLKDDYFNEKILDDVVRHFVKLDGVFRTKVVEKEDGKCSLIAIGKNSNVLQIRDIDKKYLERIDDIIDNTKDVLVYDKSHGTK